MTEPIDIENVLAAKLIDSAEFSGCGIYVANQPIDYTPPAIFISMTSTVGNVFEGFWETSVVISCIEKDEYDALRLAYRVRRCLDGWGGNGILDVEHTSTIPQRNAETAPITHTVVVMFRVIYQE